MQSFQYSAFNPYAAPGAFSGPPPGMLAHTAVSSTTAPSSYLGQAGSGPTVPPGGSSQAGGAPGSSSNNNSVSAAWAKQLEYAQISRQSGSPHHHARAAQLLSRGHSTAALAIIDPKEKDPLKQAQTPKSPVAAANKQHKRGDSAHMLVHSDSSVVPKKTSDSPDGSSTTTESWSTLDMGGLSLKSIAPALCAYTFLTALYIPHNHLTSLPPNLSSLKALVRLDASANKLTAVPPELGTLVHLRDFFLFDNQITTLPPELGTLHCLEVLGIEGNPLQDSLRSIAEKDGTSALIAFLRDSCPVPLPPPDREWVSVDPEADDAEHPAHDSFTVLCYNILCEKAATGVVYGYTPSWALAWEYRRDLVLQDLSAYNADIVALQEVDLDQYQEYFLHNLQQQDYEGIYWPRSRARTMTEDEKKHVDGCALFYKSTEFSLIEQQLIEFNQIALRRKDFKRTEDMFNRVMPRDHVAVVALLEHKHTGARIVVANAHLYWNPEYPDVKLVQAGMLLEEVEKIVDRFGKLPPRLDLPNAPTYSESNKVPVIICGDFNSTPESGVYEFLSQGNVSPKHEDFGPYVYGDFTDEGIHHSLNLNSTYATIGELPFTNHTPDFSGVLDYIWYNTDALQVTSLLGEVDRQYLKKTVGFPNAHYPSDHIAIMAELRHKRTKSKAVAGLPNGGGRK